DEIVPLLERAKAWGAEIRFIEYMDVGGATQWSRERVVSREGILRTIGDTYGAIEPLGATGSAPAERFRLSDGTVFGIIASTTAPFGAACARSRLTADGLWYLCLYAAQGIDLRRPLREGASPEQLRTLIAGAWKFRADRGAEERLGLRARSPLLPAKEL